MKKFYEEKNIKDSVRDVDEATRRVKVAISQMETIDSDNDVIDLTAYNKTVPERGPKGAQLIWHLTDHIPRLKDAVGKFSDLYVEGNFLIGITDIPKTNWGNDILEFYKTGHINQHSIGFKTIKSIQVDEGKSDEHNRIKEVILYEGSTVLWGAQRNTPTLEVGKSLNKSLVYDSYITLSDDLVTMSKMMKVGKFQDDTYELVEIRMQQTLEQLKELKQLFIDITKQNTTEPIPFTQPEVDESLLMDLKNINQLFKAM